MTLDLSLRNADYAALRFSTRGRASHRRIDVVAAERVQAEGRARDVEVEREVLVHRDYVAQVALDRVARVEALRAIDGPQRLDRLARLVHRERRLGAPAPPRRDILGFARPR